MTDLFNDVNIALLCRAARVPLLYSIHTDGSKLPGGVPSLASRRPSVHGLFIGSLCYYITVLRSNIGRPRRY